MALPDKRTAFFFPCPEKQSVPRLSERSNKLAKWKKIKLFSFQWIYDFGGDPERLGMGNKETVWGEIGQMDAEGNLYLLPLSEKGFSIEARDFSRLGL
jgi:hypothetical protein